MSVWSAQLSTRDPKYLMGYSRRAVEQAYIDGLKEGIRMYAWWKDGAQYVGTSSTPLSDALCLVEKQWDELLRVAGVMRNLEDQDETARD